MLTIVSSGKLRPKAPGAPARSPLTFCSYFVLMRSMERLDPRQIADILAEAPVWARLGLGTRHPRMRTRAAHCIAETIVERLREENAPADPNQLALF